MLHRCPLCLSITERCSNICCGCSSDLISHRGKICSREQILAKIWSNEVVVLDRTINGNLSLIASIFRNLTENTLAYSGGKNIYISLAENNDDYCRILFEDDGLGVDEGQLSRLFERFYRIDKGRSRQMGGTGLGLSIVKHAVQFLGGIITVENRPTGGLRFEFTLNKK